MVDKKTISELEQSAANLIKSGRHSEALPILISILTLDPNNQGALSAIGITFEQLKRYPEAINAYNRVLKTNQNNSNLWNYKGVALFELGKYSEAIDSFTQALGISPNDENIKKNIEFALKKLTEQNNQNNLKKTNEYLALDWNKKGNVYFKQGKYNDAINAFDQALKITPNNETIQNNKIEALKNFEKSKKNPISSVIGLITLVAIIVFFGYVLGLILGSALGHVDHQTPQSLAPTPQLTQTDKQLVLQKIEPAQTKAEGLSVLGQMTIAPVTISDNSPVTLKSLGQLLQEEEDKKANSISQAIDYTNPTTRDFAVGLVKNTNGGSYDKIGVNQICDIWDTIRPPHWTYVNDPGGVDYYSPASRTINLGLKGDCDDFAILNAAVVQSTGGKSEIITACDSASCHAYALMYINDNEADLQSTTNYIGSRYGVKTVYYFRSDSTLLGPGYWLNLDWWADNPGGQFFNDNGEKNVFMTSGGHYVSMNLNEPVISQTVTPTIRSLESKITYNTITTPAPTFTLLPPDQRL